ncbi:MAG: glycosyltransferase family 25 protein [Sulfobacillus sp.]
MNAFFDRIFCINLDRRTDRWQTAQTHFADIGLEVIRQPAVDGLTLSEMVNSISRPALACSMSHFEVLRKIANGPWDRVLVLEDDAEFLPGANESFSRQVRELPSDWALFYLGCHHVSPPVEVNDCIWRVTTGYTTSSYGITRDFARKLVADIPEPYREIDLIYVDYQRKVPCYALKSPVCQQRPGFSDIMGTEVDYHQYFNKY